MVVHSFSFSKDFKIGSYGEKWKSKICRITIITAKVRKKKDISSQTIIKYGEILLWLDLASLYSSLGLLGTSLRVNGSDLSRLCIASGVVVVDSRPGNQSGAPPTHRSRPACHQPVDSATLHPTITATVCTEHHLNNSILSWTSEEPPLRTLNTYSITYLN